MRTPAKSAAALSVALLVLACDEDAVTHSNRPPDPPRPVQKCSAAPGTLTLGQGHPFVALTGTTLPIHSGTQGGHHVEVSVRATGPVDANNVDVRIELRRGDALLGQHLNPSTLLGTLTPGVCDYDVARIVLVDAATGALLEGDAVTALAGAAVTLRVRLSSADATLEEAYDLTLGEVLESMRDVISDPNRFDAGTAEGCGGGGGC